MSKKKWIALIILILTLIIAIVAAYLVAREDSAGTAIGQQPTPAPTPAPTPTEEPLPPLVACVTEDADEAFLAALDGVRDADLVQVSYREMTGLAEVEAVVLYLAAPPEDLAPIEALLDAGVPVLAYNRAGAALPAAVTEIGYAATAPSTAAEALAAAIAYPPHDTPVRLFGVFESAQGEAYAAWSTAVAEGRVLNKGEYLPGGDESLQSFLNDRLAALYPGMLDAAFAETPALAAEIVEQMDALGRDDFEVFTIGSDADLAALAAAHPRVLPSTAETDDAAAAAACAVALGEILRGESPEDVLLEPKKTE